MGIDVQSRPNARKQPSSRGPLISVVTILALAASFLPRGSDPPGPFAEAAVNGLIPAAGAYFGTKVQPREGETEQTAIERVEGYIGRKFAIDHQYYRWNHSFPTSMESWTVGQGRIPFMNWKAARIDGSVVPWAQIASGAEDAWIISRAEAVKAFGYPVYIAFHHEPEDDVPSFGSAADYQAAFRHVVDVFRSRGVTNALFVWVMMSWSFIESTAGTFYPGDAHVDIVGVDGYNWYPGKPGSQWRSFETIIAPARYFAISHGKQLIVSEYGVQEDPGVPGRKGDWFREMLAVMKTWPEVIAVLYYDSPKIYPWWTDTSASSIEGYREAALDPHFNGGGAPPPTSPPPTTTPPPPPPPPTTTTPPPGGCTITGSNLGDVLVGTPGNDVICGLGGDDLIVGAGGNDQIDGGAGKDTASYVLAPGGVTVDLRTQTATGADGTDTFIGIENVTGSGFVDKIDGDTGDNVLVGGNGNDIVAGQEGNDFVSGGDGDDLLYMGLGNDTADGGNGIDTVSFSSSFAPVTVDLSKGWASGQGTDALMGIENMRGSLLSDKMKGTKGDDRLEGLDGNDVLLGLNGNDILLGGGGNDVLDGGPGVDQCAQDTGTGTVASCEG
jgi:RTX calcium-binding nonapeptide repeat (4 copies)/Glycosyl hydrolase family 26